MDSVIKYKVVTQNNPLEVWAIGFYGEDGKNKAQGLINDGYFHKYMYEKDKNKTLVVIPYI